MKIFIIENNVNGIAFYDYESDHIPKVGDRITTSLTGMIVVSRTWRLFDRDEPAIELWVTFE